MKITHLTIVLTLTLIGCKVTEKSVVGSYNSNYSEKLTLKSNKTFIIEYDILDTVTTTLRWTTRVTGHWALKDKSISLVVDEKKYKTWECWAIKVKGTTLIKPSRCEPTHHFTIFKKTTE